MDNVKNVIPAWHKYSLSIQEAAEYYGVAPSTLRGWINGQTMPDKFKKLGLRYKDS